MDNSINGNDILAYEKPIFELVEFDMSDIIKTSGSCNPHEACLFKTDH